MTFIRISTKQKDERRRVSCCVSLSHLAAKSAGQWKEGLAFSISSSLTSKDQPVANAVANAVAKAMARVLSFVSFFTNDAKDHAALSLRSCGG